MTQSLVAISRPLAPRMVSPRFGKSEATTHKSSQNYGFELFLVKTVYAIHEHDLRPSVNEKEYEAKVGKAIEKLHVPGLLHAYHLKGFKGERQGKYAVLWIVASEESIIDNFGTPENPKWPKDWLHYENDVLAPFLDRHPDRINFSDYHLVSTITY